MPRVREAGDSALLFELEPAIDPEVNARAIAIAAAVRRRPLPGLRDVVSTFRSVAVYFDPLRLDAEVLRQELARAGEARGRVDTGRTIDVPVIYGGEAGPDLDEVAAFARLTPEQVASRHAAGVYRVFMLGFLPGFAYMGTVAEEIAAPRRATPRLRVPAGSVGIAGRQTAVYPRESPGGWQIIGRTELPVFDLARTPAALLAPGDTVRFVRTAVGPMPARMGSGTGAPDRDAAVSAGAPSGRSLTVLRPGWLTTVQDTGRWGHQSTGVSVSGAMDLFSHRLANALVGNTADAATIEVTVAGPELRLESDTTLAVTGADFAVALGHAAVAPNVPVRGRRGEVLRVGSRRTGARAYLAFDGGIAAPGVLGSRATHVLTGVGGLGGRSLMTGDRVPLGDTTAGRPARRGIEIGSVRTSGGCRLRVLAGPQDDFFSADAFDALERLRFTIGTHSDRMGYRLQGGRLSRIDGREMISDATFTGAIQVPPSGEPILLMADRQTTGGYPQIATVISADLPVAAQLVPGDWIQFQLCSRADALAALIAQEGQLLAVG